MSLTDLTFARVTSTKDILITISGESDTLRIKKFFADGPYTAANYGIERLEFADGVALNYEEVVSLVGAPIA